MSDEHDPPRLSGSLMDAARRDLPNDAQMMALAAKIGVAFGGAAGGGAAIGAGASASGAGGAGASAGGAAAGAKAGVAGAVGAKAAGAGIVLKVMGAFVVAGAVAGGAAVGVSHVAHSNAPAPSVSIAATSARGSAMPLSRGSPLPRSSSDAVVEEVSEAPSSLASAAPVPSVKADTSVAADPAGEVKLLEQAQDALRSRPADALALCEDARARYPRGQLTQEREVIAIEALVNLGRAGAARARADRFQQVYPTSTHVRRVRALVGEN